MACVEQGCELSHHAQGFCKSHYYRARRHGVIGSTLSATPERAFAHKFEGRYRPNETGCWLWQGAFDAYGYGSLNDERTRKVKAHRVSFVLHKGPIPDGMEIMHTCDIPACVNPAHLILGTHAQNMADQVSKRRHAFGERNGHAKLSCERVQAIRSSFAARQFTQVQLAWLNDVDASTISKIVSRKYWPSVE